MRLYYFGKTCYFAPNRSIIRYEGKKLQRGLKWAPRTDTDSSLRYARSNLDT